MVWKGEGGSDKTQWNILTLSVEAREGQRRRNYDISFMGWEQSTPPSLLGLIMGHFFTQEGARVDDIRRVMGVVVGIDNGGMSKSYSKS